ncbi:MAG: peptidylprolyl isomerase [Acidobacteria bacterium]|nr:peptidylprolyl isomerase [Acidobacteriota bacterium]
MDTSLGTIAIELFESEAPISVANFLSYVDEGHYDGVIFHRVIQGFMVQGGRFTPSMSPRPTRAPIRNEAANGLDNDRYTVAMARTSQVDSATDQFFINTVDNDFLNHQVRDYGYAVFGRVIDGTDVVDRIEATPVTNAVPNTPVVIESARRR